MLYKKTGFTECLMIMAFLLGIVLFLCSGCLAINNKIESAVDSLSNGNTTFETSNANLNDNENAFDNRKYEFQKHFISADYALKDDSSIILHLDIENRHFTIKQNDRLLEQGKIYDEAPNVGLQNPGYWTEYIYIENASGNNCLIKNADGFRIGYGCQIQGEKIRPYNVECDYLLR